jgi:hypothetical protein
MKRTRWLCSVLLVLALAAAREAVAQGSPYQGAPPNPLPPPPSFFAGYAGRPFDVLCSSDIATVRVLGVNPDAAPAPRPFPITELRVQLLALHHARFEQCTPGPNFDPGTPIAGLERPQWDGEFATLRFLGGYRGGGRYRELWVPAGGPYFFPGQQLLVVLPGPTLRPLAFEVAPDGRLFRPGDGRLVTNPEDTGFFLGPITLAPVAPFFLAGQGIAERAYPPTHEAYLSHDFAVEYLAVLIALGVEEQAAAGGAGDGGAAGDGGGIGGHQIGGAAGGAGVGDSGGIGGHQIGGSGGEPTPQQPYPQGERGHIDWEKLSAPVRRP